MCGGSGLIVIPFTCHYNSIRHSHCVKATDYMHEACGSEKTDFHVHWAFQRLFDRFQTFRGFLFCVALCFGTGGNCIKRAARWPATLLKGIDGCSSGPIRFSHTGMKIAGNIRVLGGGSIADVNVVGGGSRWMRQYIICTAGEIQTEEKIGLSPASSKSPTRWRVL